METTTTTKTIKRGYELEIVHSTGWSIGKYTEKEQYTINIKNDKNLYWTALVWVEDMKVQVSIPSFYGEYHEMLEYQMLIEQVDELVRELI